MYKLFGFLVLFSLGSLLALPMSSLAQGVPTTINYQGRLTTPAGTPVPDGSYSVVFKIYDASSGGSSKWAESRSITTENGSFDVLLGSVNPIEDTVFNGSTRYLGLKVETDPELTPRTMMVTVPYAMRVSTVDGASGGVIVEGTSGGTSAEICTPDFVMGGVNDNFGTNGYLGSGDAGASGQFSNGNIGELGTYTEGVSGSNGSTGTVGRLGTVNAGVYGISNTLVGVLGTSSSGIAGYFENEGSGLSNPTIYAENANSAGIVSWFQNDATDATLVLTNNNSSGPVLKCFGPGGTLPLIVKADGRVGINEPSPSEALHVDGNICYTGLIGACSDKRYKKDIARITGSLDKILEMRGITYRWKQEEFPHRDFDDKTHLGFIAQEVEELCPEIVMTDDNGYKSIDYSRLTPVLVEAIKDQQNQIEAQQEQITSQQIQIDKLAEMVKEFSSERSHARLGESD
jgi:hypothetical protein